MKKSRRRYVYGVLCFIVLFLFTACTSTLQKEKEDNTHYEDYSITDSTIIESQDDNTDSWVVTHQGKVIGQIQLFNFFNHNTCAEVGYFIKKSYWNRGINTKVLKAVCKFGIEIMGLERIEAFAHVDNIGSNRTLQKAGFAKEGTLRKRFLVKGELFDCNAYSFVKDDLKKSI